MDTVARLGGDEFVVLVEDVPDLVNIASIAQKLLAAATRPFIIEGQEFLVTASIGITTYPEDSQDTASLLKNADIAMYRAKEQGENTYQFYSAQMNVHSLERLTLEANLRRALERNEFLLHYQPKIDLKSGRITGMEALVRWQDPEAGLVSPSAFIPVAEESGLIVPMSEWAIREAARQVHEWKQAIGYDQSIAVNLPSRLFERSDLVTHLERSVAH